MTLAMGDYELLGELGLQVGDLTYVDDLADVGYAQRMPMPRYPAPRPAPYRPPGVGAQMLPIQRLVPQVPGAPRVGLRLQPLGFPVVTFTATSGTTLTTTSRPQRPFKPKRLVVVVARTGATATGLITVTALSIGTNNQFVSAQPIAAEAFAPGAFDVNLEMAACSTALDITIGYATSAAPAMTDTIAVGTTLIGEAIG